jgi:hypothetical protein
VAALQAIVHLIAYTVAYFEPGSGGAAGYAAKAAMPFFVCSFNDNFQAKNLGFPFVRGHVTFTITLRFEAIAKQAPEVSFIHDYPGFVKTGMSRELTGLIPALMKVAFSPIMAILKIPIDEVGEH